MVSECRDDVYDIRGIQQSCEEQIINRLITAAMDVGSMATLNGQRALEDARAALIALLARDDARIARLEAVAKAVKGCMLFAPQDGDSGATELYDDYWRKLNDGLAWLDADAPGGG